MNVRVLTEEGSFWQNSRTIFRAWGRYAECPFAGKERNWALRICFVGGIMEQARSRRMNNLAGQLCRSIKMKRERV